MQLVKLGVTQSGIPGLFTGGYLAWNLTPEQYVQFLSDRAALIAFAEKRGFEVMPESASTPAPVPHQSGPMSFRFEHGRFLVELMGEHARVWESDGDPSYTGPIDGIQLRYPDLFAHMIACGYIKLSPL